MVEHEIISKLRTRYAQCKTYQDCGIFRTNPELGWMNGLSFRTFFVNPGKFMVEFGHNDHPPKSLVWSNGIQTFCDIQNKSKKAKSTLAAMELLDGMGIPFFILPLLIPGLPLNSLFENSFEMKQIDSQDILLTSHCKPWINLWIWIRLDELKVTKIAVESCSIKPLIRYDRLITCEYSEVKFDQRIAEDLFNFQPQEKCSEDSNQFAD